MRWDTSCIPDLAGTVAIVTGSNTGIGYQTALALARANADVVLACRNPDKGAAAVARLTAAHPGARAHFLQLDLASLASVRRFATDFAARFMRLDRLVNNAGVMFPPRTATADGFELQFGVNHLGHFALSGLLLPVLARTPGARVVSVSSLAHRFGRIDFTNLNAERRYVRTLAYAQSKLACLMFAYELQRRLERRAVPVASLAAHPGTTVSELGRHQAWTRLVQRFVQRVERGALPILRAATDPDARGGDYYGPDGLLTAYGDPVKERSARHSHDVEVAQRLWARSEQLTGVAYP